MPDLSKMICLGNFDCSNNDLTSLKGAPEEVKSFNCKYTKISSLIGGPKKAMAYYCPATLESLEGAPKDCDNFGVYNASLGDKKLKNKGNWDFIIARIKNGEIKVR